MENKTNTTANPEINEGSQAEEMKVSTGAVAEPVATTENTAASDENYGTNATDHEDNSVLGSQIEETKTGDGDSKSLMRAEFEKLIKGDYKEFYEERIRENLSRRFKENSLIKEKNHQNTEIVEMLYSKYNVEEGNIAALKDAIESDDAYLVTQAHKRGMSTEDYKYLKQLEYENKKFHQLSSQYEAMEHANRTVEKWYEESQRLKESYPDFNIFEESKNKDFVALIKSGIDVKTAYEVLHHDEIVSDIAAKAAKDAEIKTAEAIRQRAMRPAENGLSSQSSVIIKNDVSKLSPSERAEIARRVSRGERITF